jgi:hypothetical protein
MVIKDIREIDDIARRVFGRTEHLLSLDLAEYNHLKESSAAIEVIKMDIPKLTDESIASVEEALKDIDTSKANACIVYICENNIITVEQTDILMSLLLDKYFGDADRSFGFSGFVNSEVDAEVYVFVGYKSGEP